MNIFLYFLRQIQAVSVTTAYMKDRMYYSVFIFQMKIVVAKLQFQSKTLTTLTFYRVDGISNGVIIGVVLGNLFILAVGLIVVFMYRRRKHLSECIFTVYITMHVTQNLFSYLIFFSNFTMYQRNTTLLYLFKKKFFLTICIVYFF